MSIESACDELIASGILEHEHGIPRLWPRSAPALHDCELEAEYYQVHKDFLLEVDELVYLDTLQSLQNLDELRIRELYSSIEDDKYLGGLDASQVELFLLTHNRNFRTQLLMSETVTLALPILRAVHHGNAALTDAEFTILNNLKKLYSRHNEHPSNIRALVAAYEEHKRKLDEKHNQDSEIKSILTDQIHDKLQELQELTTAMELIENTLQNRINGEDDETTQLGKRYRRLRGQVDLLRLLCDFLPNLILCQAKNWYNDKKLREVVERCQQIELSLPDMEDLADLSELGNIDCSKLFSALEEVSR